MFRCGILAVILDGLCTKETIKAKALKEFIVLNIIGKVALCIFLGQKVKQLYLHCGYCGH